MGPGLCCTRGCARVVRGLSPPVAPSALTSTTAASPGQIKVDGPVTAHHHLNEEFVPVLMTSMEGYKKAAMLDQWEGRGGGCGGGQGSAGHPGDGHCAATTHSSHAGYKLFITAHHQIRFSQGPIPGINQVRNHLPW